MGEVEIHKGKFKVLAYGDEEVIKYIKDHQVEIEVEVEDGKIFDYDCKDKNKKILTLFRNQKNETHVLIKHLEHIEKDDNDYLDEFNRVNKDTFEYLFQFYNGGTCASEILEDHLEHIDYDNYNGQRDTLTIEADESYLIYDALNEYILNNKFLTGFDRVLIRDIQDKILKIQTDNKW